MYRSGFQDLAKATIPLRRTNKKHSAISFLARIHYFPRLLIGNSKIPEISGILSQSSVKWYNLKNGIRSTEVQVSNV